MAREESEALRGYMEAVGTNKLFVSPGRDWRQFYAWVWNRRFVPLRKIFVTTRDIVPYLLYLRQKVPMENVEIVKLEIDEPVDYFQFDREISATDLGWGVDKEKWAALSMFRPWRSKPVFYMSTPHPQIEHRLSAVGYDVVTGQNRQYGVGDVVIVPEKCNVPIPIYEAAASRCAVVSTRENARWLENVVGYSTYIEDGADAIASAVMDSDFKFVGMMAQDMVPSLKEFHDQAKSILLSI